MRRRARVFLDSSSDEIVWATARLLYVGSGIAAEALAADSLLREVHDEAFAWHLGASLIVAAVGAALRGVPARVRVHHAAFCLVLGFCLPGAGVLGLALVVMPGFRVRGRRDEPSVLLLPQRDVRDGSRAAAKLAERMLAPRHSTGQRVQTLLARRGMEGSAAVPGLRAALRDPSEEVRLLAHSLLDRRETRVRCEIAAIEAELAGVEGQGEVARARDRTLVLRRRLARLYWTLVTDDLAQGALGQAAIEQACRHAESALTLRSDAELYVLLVRAQLRRSDGLGAWRWLQRAEKAGVTSKVRAPLYAEAAFVLRQFKQIPTWLERAGPQRGSREIRIHSFWSRSPSNSSRRWPKHD